MGLKKSLGTKKQFQSLCHGYTPEQSLIACSVCKGAVARREWAMLIHMKGHVRKKELTQDEANELRRQMGLYNINEREKK